MTKDGSSTHSQETKGYEPYADASQKPDVTYEVGDLVLINRRRVHLGRTKKFVCRAIGPYQVVRRVSDTCYTVEDLPYNRRGQIHRLFNAHVSQIRPYRSRREEDWVPENISDDETPEEWEDEFGEEDPGPVEIDKPPDEEIFDLNEDPWEGERETLGLQEEVQEPELPRRSTRGRSIRNTQNQYFVYF